MPRKPGRCTTRCSLPTLVDHPLIASLGLESLGLEVLALLIGVAFLAGLIDAIAGGGGLLVLPALLSAGLPPTAALATNKLQGVFGTLTATLNFVHKGALKLREFGLAISLTFLGSVSGATLVSRIGDAHLSALLPLLLIGFALYFLFSPRVGDIERTRRIGERSFAIAIGFGIGFYDGFFGPGTGAFFAFAYVALAGFSLTRATAHAKALNFTSNLAAMILFAVGGHTVWALGLIMGIAQIAGAWIGSHLVLRHGASLVRPALVTVSVILSVRLLWQQMGGVSGP
ncbi:MAG: TSUP family transporter [Gammaproteobacteria bacterium]|nr:TSUP family transporter [Gammaproteobacteria bacterium]